MTGNKPPARKQPARPALPPRTLFGVVETINKTSIQGWAVDMAQPGQAAHMILVADGRPLGTFRCSELRPDVNANGFPGAELGFNLRLPDALLDGAPHKLSIRFRSGEPLPFLTASGEQHGEYEFQFRPTVVIGRVDGMHGSAIRGWAFRVDERTGVRTGGVSIEVRANGVRIDQVKAGLIRNDVAEVHGCEPHCGFLYSPPTRFRDGRTFVLEFLAVPEDTQLEGSPFSGATPTHDLQGQLHGMHAKVERLCTELYALKDELRQLVTKDEHTLDAYNEWAPQYYHALRARLAAERRTPRYGALLGSKPKVSVICPAYKPDLADFASAVASVRNQTWADWELVIVDDGSGSKALTEVIKRFCAEDARIRAVPHKKNCGISAATNTAIAAATGDYIALFDHDDLLVDVALEVMLLAARHTGAPVLYSDEDKIDRYGLLSEPHLKSDWNYRLLLTNNYVCHLLMVDAATLRAVGPLDSRHDGAQDHDLVLRLFEAVGARGIHHVPELLYHWRKTAGSTAAQQSSKSYAVEAGRSALLAHAGRRGLQATVTAPFASTLFDVRWQFSAEPKVSILVPFKDQLHVTRRCIECVLDVTAYGNFEVVLIDNWSSDPATADWLRSLADPRVRVLRVEERFNFSRVNNLAAQQLDTDYLLFLNNDVFVSQPDWMRLIVNEALASPAVGAVGVRLLYPNSTVQHAGVVLGVGGVADHTFRYYPADEPGYCFRSVVAQELSAVTAACMLCRMDAFRAVGMLDADRLAVAFNDVDLCLKLGAAGYQVIYTPAVVAEHHESLSRGSDMQPHALPRFYEENQTMMDRWGHVIRRDPRYNQHFSSETGMFEKLSTASLDPRRAPPLLHDLPSPLPEVKPAPAAVDASGKPAAARRRKAA